MGFDKPRQKDIPRVSEDDPLPSRPEQAGRWGAPYISDKTGCPTVFTRQPLVQSEITFGLKSCLSADTLERLKALMAKEDEKYKQYLFSRKR